MSRRPGSWDIVINHRPPPKAVVNPEDNERKRKLDELAYQRELKRINRESASDYDD